MASAISFVRLFFALCKIAFVVVTQIGFISPCFAAETVFYFAFTPVFFTARSVHTTSPLVALFAEMHLAIFAVYSFGTAIFAVSAPHAPVLLAAQSTTSLLITSYTGMFLAILTAFLCGATVQPVVHLFDTSVFFAERHAFSQQFTAAVCACMFLTILSPRAFVATWDLTVRAGAAMILAIQTAFHSAFFALFSVTRVIHAMLSLVSGCTAYYAFCRFMSRMHLLILCVHR